MLTFFTSTSGGQVAQELENDEEEFAELLKGLSGFEGSQFAEIAEYLDLNELGAAVAFLRGLADTLEAAGK